MKDPKKFFYADPHFGHNKIIQFENRPFENLNDMHSKLIKNWNEVVSDQDNIFVIGDVSFTGTQATEEIIKQLRGKKHLIMGNHDWSHSMTKWQSMGFDSVYQQAVMNLSKEVKVKLCHFPYTDTRYPEYVPVKEDGVWLIHGHQHGKGKIVDAENKMICVSLELWDYRPVESNTIINMINKIGGLNESNKTN